MRRAGRVARLCAVLAVAAALFGARAQADFTVPPLTGPVVDTARLLTPEATTALDEALRRLWNGGGSQIVVLTVPDLGGVPIEQASISVTDRWKLGKAKQDNGVLLLVAKREHGIRIEVGQGLEGQLTDAYSRRIIDNVMVPFFRSGDPSGGVLAGVSAIARYTDPGEDLGLVQGSTSAEPSEAGDDGGIPAWVLVLFVLVIIIASLSRRSRFVRRSGYWGGGWGGGGWGGGGGGGFSGGGGGFSGGGSSGSW